jgi:hypothetical protein
MVIAQITSPTYCAALVIENDHVVEAAPIIKWTIGKHRGWIVSYFRQQKGFKIEAAW